MIIDDNEIDIFIHKKIIESMNIAERILTFTHGKDALNHLKLIEDETTYYSLFAPQLILLDINMPDMNGFEFLEEFDKLKIFKQKPVEIFIVSSSSNFLEIEKANNNINCSAFIQKPLEMNKLLYHINSSNILNKANPKSNTIS